MAQARAALGGSGQGVSRSGVPAQCRTLGTFRHPVIAVSADVWDTDKMLLGVPGGHVILRTGELHAGDPKKYISLSCSVAPEQGDAPSVVGIL